MTWMNLEQTTLRQATQKDNYCVIPPDEALEQSLSRRQKGWEKGIRRNCWEVQSSGDGRWQWLHKCASTYHHRTVHLERDSDGNFYILDSLPHTEKKQLQLLPNPNLLNSSPQN